MRSKISSRIEPGVASVVDGLRKRSAVPLKSARLQSDPADHRCSRASLCSAVSTAWAKYADAVFRIVRPLQFEVFAFELLEPRPFIGLRPACSPASRSAWRTYRPNDSVRIPSLSPTDRIAGHCDECSGGLIEDHPHRTITDLRRIPGRRMGSHPLWERALRETERDSPVLFLRM